MGVKRIQSKEDLFTVINTRVLKKTIFIFFMFLSFVPLIILIINIFIRFDINNYDKTNFLLYSFDISAYNYTWYSIIQIVGNLCLVVAVLYMANIIYTKDQKIVKRNFIVPSFIITLFVWSLLSAFFSGNTSLCFFGNYIRHEGILTYIAYLGFFFSAYFLNDKKYIQKYLSSFVIVAAIVVLPIAVSNKKFDSLLNLNVDVVNSIFNNGNHSGYYNCVFMMSCSVLFLIMDSHSAFLKYIYLFLFSYAVFTQLQNHSFGSYLGEGIGLVTLLLLTLVRRNFMVSSNDVYFKRSLLLLVVFIFFSISYTFYNPWLISDLSSFFPSLKNLISGTVKEKNEVGSGRGQLILKAIQFVKERPLFGYGPDNLLDEYLKYGIHIDRVHCVPLNIAASEGIPAAAFYLGALISMFISFIKKLRNLDILDIGLFSIGVAYFCSSLVGNSSYYVTPYFCIIFGLLAGRIARKPLIKDLSRDKEEITLE